jgi:hypothetical protein
MTELKHDLIELLEAKSKDALDKGQTHHDYIRLLKNFRDTVEPELSQINLLFPEFTPHNEKHHISSLFRITAELLDNEILNHLNCCELFLLLCSLYGHDWAMGVSLDEQTLVFVGHKQGSNGNSINLLQNESLRLKEFCQKRGITLNEAGYVLDFEKLDKSHVQDYFRETHAIRSKRRIEKHFQTIDPILGNVLGEICAGHWYDSKIIRELPDSISVGGFSINQQVLATYIRLIDLLDIGNNRTPYKLWKFVNPKNIISKEEWGKHQALSPITVKNEGGYKILQIHGSTEHYKIYAALEDMKGWVVTQFEQNRDILRKNLSYDPKLSFVEWKVNPIGFEPLSVRFEFNRGSILEILSDEIYKSDPYVFVRELLQNAIDATKLRNARLELKGLSTISNSKIKINVSHYDNGDFDFTIKDNGIGMDEVVIKNYLSVAGQSYYQSDEFANLGVTFNPISKFGIGILSCFMITDEVSIKTTPDPYIFSNSESYEIEIPSLINQFHVKRLGHQENIGTEVSLKVKAEGWRRGIYAKKDNLQITEYLKIIVGYVDIDIEVVENGSSTKIVSPFKKDLNDQNGSHSINPYDFKRIFLSPDDVEIDELFEYNVITINNLDKTTGQHISGYIGNYTFKDFKAPLYSKNSRRSPRELQEWAGLALAKETLESVPKRIYWGPFKKGNDVVTTSISKSATLSNYCQVYLNGLLVPKYTPDFARGAGAKTPLPLVSLNLSISSDSNSISVSRFEFKSINNFVLETVTSALLEIVKTKYLQKYKEATPREKFRLLSEITYSYHLSEKDLINLVGKQNWPIILADINGKVFFETLGNFNETQFITWSRSLSKVYTDVVISGFHDPDWLEEMTINELSGIPYVKVLQGFMGDRDDLISTNIHNLSYAAARLIGNQVGYYLQPTNSESLANGFQIWNRETPDLEIRSVFNNGNLKFQAFNKPFEERFCTFFIGDWDMAHVSKCLFNERHAISKCLIKIFSDQINSQVNRDIEGIKERLWQSMPFYERMYRIVNGVEQRIFTNVNEWLRKVHEHFPEEFHGTFQVTNEEFLFVNAETH